MGGRHARILWDYLEGTCHWKRVMSFLYAGAARASRRGHRLNGHGKQQRASSHDELNAPICHSLHPETLCGWAFAYKLASALLGFRLAPPAIPKTSKTARNPAHAKTPVW